MKQNVLEIPIWLTANEAQSHIPTALWDMMSHHDSLTAHLRKITRNQTSLRLLFANWGEAKPIERQALNLAAQERTWIRCIEHRFKNTVWVYARGVFPEKTISATGKLILGLGVQSLGDIIFKDSNTKRSAFSYCLLNENNIDYPVINGKKNVWARQSTLYLQKQPLLITEFFMPEAYAQFNS